MRGRSLPLGYSVAVDPARQRVADRAAGAGDYRLKARGGSDLSCPREPRPHDRPGQAPGMLRSSQRGRAATAGRSPLTGNPGRHGPVRAAGRVSDRAKGSLMELSERNDVIKTVIR